MELDLSGHIWVNVEEKSAYFFGDTDFFSGLNLMLIHLEIVLFSENY